MLLIFYAIALVATVIAGASLTARLLSSHRRTQLAMSFVSGIMLGVAVFHLLPHALYINREAGAIDSVALWMMAGLLAMFLLQRLFHFHQHENVAECEAHDHENSHSHEPLHIPSGQFGGAGVLLGLAVHALLDGVALAASIQADWHSSGGQALWPLAGLGVFLAILLHKPLDAMTIALFAERRRGSKTRKHLLLVAYGLLCPLTAGLLLYALPGELVSKPSLVAAALAFSSGIFLCIALSDLLPEVHFHDHDRLLMTAMLLAGIAVAWSLKHLEVMHEPHAEYSPKAYDSRIVVGPVAAPGSTGIYVSRTLQPLWPCTGANTCKLG